MKKRSFAALLTVVSLFSILCTSASAKGYLQPQYNPYTQTRTIYTVVSTKFVRDEYSKWHRLSGITTNDGIAGRQGGYKEEQTTEVSLTTSFSLSIPIKKITLDGGLEHTIKTSRSTTIVFDLSAGLDHGMSTAFYWREHFKVYEVTLNCTKRYYDPVRLRYGSIISQWCTKETIRESQDLTSHDYQWLYTYDGEEVLANNVDPGKCDGNLICK